MKKTACLIFLWGMMWVSGARAEEPLFAHLSDKLENVKVERVIKSDLIVLDNGRKVRLIGVKAIDNPRKNSREVKRDEYGFVVEEEITDPTVPIDEQASDFAYQLLYNKKVTVEFDTDMTDDNGYIWGYVFLPDGTMANDEILRQGLSQLQIQPPNTKYADRLRDAYREARQEKRGIHAE